MGSQRRSDLTVVDGFLVSAINYKDPKTNKLRMKKLVKHYALWEKLFSGTYPLNRGEMIRYYLDQHLRFLQKAFLSS